MSQVLIQLQNNPLHISIFPTISASQTDPLEFSFLLSTSLDIFEARLASGQKTDSSDFGLLQAIDENLAMYGWLTNTGVKVSISLPLN